jgi:hypothetical protein
VRRRDFIAAMDGAAYRVVAWAQLRKTIKRIALTTCRLPGKCRDDTRLFFSVSANY